MKRTISNSDDIIDSRDVIARIDELENDRADLVERWAAPRADDSNAPDLTVAEWDEGDDGEELKALQALQDEAEPYCSDWRYGEALIRDSYFEDYARNLAEDIGAISKDANWPNNYIDWEAAAEALQQDYTSVDYAGVAYWIRS